MLQEQVVLIACSCSSRHLRYLESWYFLIYVYFFLISKTLKGLPPSFTNLIFQFYGIVKVLLIFNIINFIRWEDTNCVLLSFCEAIQFQRWLQVLCFADVLPHGE